MMKKEYKKPDILVEELLPESFLQTGSMDEEFEEKEEYEIDDMNEVI